MKKIFIITIAVFIIGIGYYAVNLRRVEAPAVSENQAKQKDINENTATNNQPKNDASPQIPAELQPSLPRAGERVTKKSFGIFVSPQNSPVQPERFRGYHTGVDFEIFPEEINSDVEIKAVCFGKLEVKRSVSGYGGAAVQFCKLNSGPVTVIYGHLKLDSIAKNIGENIEAGETIGVLGNGFSTETDGERKHLHLGIHKGSEINILGYVQNKVELSSWTDICLYICE